MRLRRIEAHRDVILGAIEEQVDIMLVELAEMLRPEHGAVFAPSTIWRFRDRHLMTVEKKTAYAREQERPDVLARRRAWFKAQPDLNPEQLVFIDETGASTKMARLRGRQGACMLFLPPYSPDFNPIEKRLLETKGHPTKIRRPNHPGAMGCHPQRFAPSLPKHAQIISSPPDMKRSELMLLEY